MKYYLIGYHSYEECPDEVLGHEHDFTAEDIENLLVEYILSRKDLPHKEYNFKNQLSDIMFHYEDGGGFRMFLCDKKGFVQLKYSACYKPFGWADVFDEKDWEGDRSDLNSLTKKLLRTNQLTQSTKKRGRWWIGKVKL